MATRLSGKPVADSINEQVRREITALRAHGVSPTLAIVRVGERGEDIAYERGATKRCQLVGIDVKSFGLRADCTQEQLIEVLNAINLDEGLHGCLMLRPLPKHLNEHAACQMISPEKDVDGVTDTSLTGVFAERRQGFPPNTPSACMAILEHYGVALAGKRVTVVGRSLVVGKPVAMMLMAKHATVTVCHSRTVDLPAACRQSNILIAAIGRASTIDRRHLSPDQVVIDVGVNVLEDGSLCGDVVYEDADAVAGAITPVPGGVGLVTTSILARNVAEAASRRIQAWHC